MMEFVNGKDDIPYMKWKIKNVWNHQPVIFPHSIETIWDDLREKWQETMVFPHLIGWRFLYFFP
jgi:hypothetical protein